MDVHNARRRALGGAGNGRFVALLLALLGAALTALVGPPAAGATVTATPLQVGASTYDDYPTATATVEVWDRFANGHWIVHAQPRAGGATVRVNGPRTYGYAPSVIRDPDSVI